MKAVIFWALFTGFFFLFREIHLLEQVKTLLQKTRWDLDIAARQRALDSRRQLIDLQQKHTLWTALERKLCYSGIKMRFPGVTAEIWIAGNLVMAALVMVVMSAFLGVIAALAGITVFIAIETVIFWYLQTVNLRSVNEHMIKFLDFLGNYSITAGEVTSIFHQVGRYMEEPLKSVLDACYYEAQTTGDVGLALLSMAEKIEHPKFKELARNMEISIRYCADFTALVSGSRRSLREYLRISQKRKGMLGEALVNMAILLGLALVVLITVGSLVQVPAMELLTGTLPGKIGMIALAVIGVLFAGQLRKIQ